jgi:hypothetical protein
MMTPLLPGDRLDEEAATVFRLTCLPSALASPKGDPNP